MSEYVIIGFIPIGTDEEAETFLKECVPQTLGDCYPEIGLYRLRRKQRHTILCSISQVLNAITDNRQVWNNYQEKIDETKG